MREPPRPRSLPARDREQLKARLASLAGSCDDVLLAYLHGSFLDGDFRDVDVAVLLSPTARTHEGWSDAALEREWSRSLGLPVDVRVLNDAPLGFRFNVLRGGERLVVKDEDVREAFECGTLALYHDFAFHLREYRREALGLPS